MAITTTSPTEIDYYADHDSVTLRSIIQRYDAQGASIAVNSGADHPLVAECIAISTAAFGQLVKRGESP